MTYQYLVIANQPVPGETTVVRATDGEALIIDTNHLGDMVFDAAAES